MALKYLIFISLFIFNISKYLTQSQIKAIDDLIEKRMKSVRLNKFGIIIVNSSSIIHKKVFGEGITTESFFTIGSVTKSFTALGILKLNISLDEPLSSFELKDYLDDDLAKQLTVQDLMSHSSGLDSSSGKQVGEKGKFLYSNYNYALLGKIIEKKSEEKNYGDFIKKHIFDELNMTNSGTNFDSNIIDSYDNFFGCLSKYGYLESDYNEKDGWNIPAGFIRSTIDDMGKYIQSYLNGINNDYLEQMGEPKTNITHNLYYGMGLFVRNRSGTLIYDHSGSINSFLTHIYIYPELDFAYFIFTNTNDAFCPGPFYRFVSILETLILDDEIIYEQTFTSLDSLEFNLIHTAIDLIILLLITIPITYLIITIIRKIQKKKPSWFDGVKGKIIFGVEVFILIILPIILLISLTYAFTRTKDFLFALLTITISMIVTFFIKLGYFFIYKKLGENNSNSGSERDDSQENLFGLKNL